MLIRNRCRREQKNDTKTRASVAEASKQKRQIVCIEWQKMNDKVEVLHQTFPQQWCLDVHRLKTGTHKVKRCKKVPRSSRVVDQDRRDACSPAATSFKIVRLGFGWRHTAQYARRITSIRFFGQA